LVFLLSQDIFHHQETLRATLGLPGSRCAIRPLPIKVQVVPGAFGLILSLLMRRQKHFGLILDVVLRAVRPVAVVGVSTSHFDPMLFDALTFPDLGFPSVEVGDVITLAAANAAMMAVFWKCMIFLCLMI
jgi:hypothetical protein